MSLPRLGTGTSTQSLIDLGKCPCLNMAVKSELRGTEIRSDARIRWLESSSVSSDLLLFMCLIASQTHSAEESRSSDQTPGKVEAESLT